MGARSNSEVRIRVAIGVALVVAGIIGLFIAARDHRDAPKGPTVVGVADAAPAAAVVPARPGPDLEGATAAAVGFVATTGKVAEAAPLTRRDLVLAMATAGYGPELVEQVDRQFDDLRFKWSGTTGSSVEISWRAYPLASHVEALDGGRVRVRVWSVAVMSMGASAVPRQIWSTATLELVDVHGAFKVDRWETASGPTPVAAGEAELPTAASVSEVTGWSPTKGGS